MKVRIYQPHTHDGKRYIPGPDGIELDMAEHDKKFLEEHTDTLKKPAAKAAASAPDKA